MSTVRVPVGSSVNRGDSMSVRALSNKTGDSPVPGYARYECRTLFHADKLYLRVAGITPKKKQKKQ